MKLTTLLAFARVELRQLAHPYAPDRQESFPDLDFLLRVVDLIVTAEAGSRSGSRAMTRSSTASCTSGSIFGLSREPERRRSGSASGFEATAGRSATAGSWMGSGC